MMRQFRPAALPRGLSLDEVIRQVNLRMGDLGRVIEAPPHAGSTANRPGAVPLGYQFYDTTLARPLWWDGAGWRDASGAPA